MTVLTVTATYDIRAGHTDLLNITRRASRAPQTVGTPPTPDDELVVHAYPQGAAPGLARVLHVQRARREHRQGLLGFGRVGGSSDLEFGCRRTAMSGGGGGRLDSKKDLSLWVLGAVDEEGCEVFWVEWLSDCRAWTVKCNLSVERGGCHCGSG
jgi:hypothetical protein